MLLPLVRPRLIALDMDGTLCDRNVIPQANLAALVACAAAGIRIAILTGRRRLVLAPRLEEIYAALHPAQAARGASAWEIRAAEPWHIATNSGGLVWEYPGWRQVVAQVMPRAIAEAVADELEPHSLNVHVNPVSSGGLELLHYWRPENPSMARYFTPGLHGALHVQTLAELLSYDILLFALPAEETLVKQLAQRLRARFDPAELSVMTVRWPPDSSLALEAYSPAVNKATALAAMALQLGVPQSAVAAAGDDVNDCSMLAWAGHSVAMPQAPHEVAAAASNQLEGSGAEALAPWLCALAALPVSS